MKEPKNLTIKSVVQMLHKNKSVSNVCTIKKNKLAKQDSLRQQQLP